MPIQYSDDYWKTCWARVRGVDGDVKGAILGAGLGKRLDPLTAHHLPKPLFPLGGKVPIAEIWVRRFIRSGITDVSMNLCVLADTIKRHFQDGARFGVDLTYVEEETPTGTLGGVCKMALGRTAKALPKDKAAPHIHSFEGSTIVVPSGDIVAEFEPAFIQEMFEIHRKNGAAVTMVLNKIPLSRRKDFGTVVLDSPVKKRGVISATGRVCSFVEKDPNSPSCLNNSSIYMIETDLLRELDRHRTEARLDVAEPFYDFGKHVFPAMLGQLPYVRLPKDYAIWGLQFDGPWFDVGNKRDYLEVNKLVLDGTFKVPLTYEPLPWGYLGTNVSINFSQVEIHSPVVIGNDCVIEPGAVLGPYAVIGDGWRIERGAKIRNSVLWERYPYYLDGKKKIPSRDRLLVDPHEVRRGVLVDQSIVAGGCIEADTVGKTVDVRADGRMAVLSIDYAPSGPRV